MKCICCGEEKKTRFFSWTKKNEYVKTCRECGHWMRLFRKVLGYTPPHTTRMKKPAEHLQSVMNIWGKL